MKSTGKMKILVTGGAGYIGSHTVVELLQCGHDVIIIDNYSNSEPSVIDRIEKIAKAEGTPVSCRETGNFGRILEAAEGDVCDYEFLKSVFERHGSSDICGGGIDAGESSLGGIDAVIHFAGFKAVGESVEKPLMYYRNNLGATTNLIRVMKETGVKNIIFSSSATVYGMDNQVPFSEDMPTSCTNPYGWTKLMSEQILSDEAAADKGFKAVLLRYFNPVGAHPSGMIGENPKGIPNNLMPYIQQVAAGKREKLTVFGDDYDTPDGTGVRDYIHVVDLARGHVKALEWMAIGGTAWSKEVGAAGAETTGAAVFNLGTGKGTSVIELVTAFARVNGVPVPYEIGPRRAGDIATCYADAAKAAQVLGWKAEKGIDLMCADAWRWQQNAK